MSRAHQVRIGAEEPWLRGPLAGIPPAVMPVFFSFQQVVEDLRRHTAGLTDDQIWQSTAGGSLGFQLKHMAGSVDRLATYLSGRQLTDTQLAFLKSESVADTSLSALLTSVEKALQSAEQVLMSVNPDKLYEPRTVGRKNLPTTVLGLIVHLSEHTQRHLGQAITISKFLRQLG